MRVFLTSPYLRLTGRGNAVSAGRLIAGLKEAGAQVDAVLPEEVTAGRRLFEKSDLCHGFHLYHSGKAFLSQGTRLGRPLVLTATGTDLNHDIEDESRGCVVKAAVDRSDAVILYHEAAKERLIRHIPKAFGKAIVIPPAPKVSLTGRDFRSEWGLGDDAFLFLLPAGVRKVKNVTSAIEPLQRLRRDHPTVRLVIAGPVIEEDEMARLEEAARRRDWVSYVGAVPHDAMSDLYDAADAVLNTSRSEGLANVLLEAMHAGKPILASAIEGNAAVIQNERNGLLYKTPEDFLASARRLVEEPELRRRLGERAQAFIESRYPPGAEIERHLSLYGSLIT